MKNLSILLASIVLSVSSVACSPSMSEPMVPSVEKKAVTAPLTQGSATAPMTSPSCHCEGKGEDCLISGAKEIGEGAWDLTKRGANWVEGQAKDPENQKKAGEAWEAIKDGAGSLYGKAKDAVSDDPKLPPSKSGR